MSPPEGYHNEHWSIESRAGTSIRDATKWLLAAFAALFVILAGGLQFSSVTRIDDPVRDAVAVVCIAVAFTATIAVIFSAARVLTDLGLTLDDLLAREIDAKILQANLSQDPHSHRLVGEALELDDLLLRINGNRGLTRAQSMSPTRLRDALTEAAQVPCGLPEVRPAAESDVRLLLDAANRVHYSQIFTHLLRGVRVASIVVPLAILGFAWATSSAADLSADVTAPFDTGVTFTAGTDHSRLGLGPTCSAASLRAVAIGGTLARPLVVTRATSRCAPATFVVTPELGISIPEAAQRPDDAGLRGH